MPELRVVMELEATDYEGMADALAQAVTAISEDLPGVVAWESFGDKSTGRFLLYKVFSDVAAGDAYEEYMHSSGLRDNLIQHLKDARVIVLGDMTQSRFIGMAEESGWDMLLPEAGLDRRVVIP